MRVWRRLSRVAVLAVFITGNFASALPLVYCLAAGDHHRVEFAHGSPHSAQQILAARSDATRHSPATSASAVRDCLDMPLVSSAKAPARIAEVEQSRVKVQATWSSSSLVRAVTTSALPRTCGVSRALSKGLPPPDVALAARRTVVLLI